MSVYDDNPGLFTFLGCLVILVMAAIGLSAIVDRRFVSSKNVTAMDRAVRATEEEIERLEIFCRNGTRELAAAEPLQRTAEELAGARRDLEARTTRVETMRETRNRLLAGLAATESDFQRYREQYRQSARAAAIGESQGSLTTRSGREFRSVVITRVTDAGLEIRHEHGTARLPARDLGPAFQERFQWTE